MYITTIVKIKSDTDVFAGFNASSIPYTLEEILNELDYYNSDKSQEIKNMVKGDRIMIETSWENYIVFITIYFN